jgi:murein DD-endopeptidase MepM/ murein hydrolase activator NlpD
MAVATLVSVAFGEAEPPSPGVIIDWVTRADQPTRSPEPPTATSHSATEPGVQPPADHTATPIQTEATATEPPALFGFTYPIAGGCLPEDDNLMPNAARAYRNGVHEGVDFYDSDNCAPIGLNTEVLAAKGGTVIRADVAYKDPTPDEVAYLESLASANGYDEQILDAFRGRQVWIDHGNGVVSRYCHLNGIAEGIAEGTVVETGQLIGYVGESGTPESVSAPGSQVHLHFELRVSETFLGLGLDPAAVRLLYQQAFSP